MPLLGQQKRDGRRGVCGSAYGIRMRFQTAAFVVAVRDSNDSDRRVAPGMCPTTTVFSGRTEGGATESTSCSGGVAGVHIRDLRHTGATRVTGRCGGAHAHIVRNTENID